VKSLKEELRKRSTPAGPEVSSRRDQDKILADRLARLDEKIESLWGRVADLEEHFEGEGGRTRDTEFDETPDRDFYEH
jgi:predicted nuclease with TOPRIM domain